MCGELSESQPSTLFLIPQRNRNCFRRNFPSPFEFQAEKFHSQLSWMFDNQIFAKLLIEFSLNHTGFIFFDFPGAQQQATIRIFLAHDSVRSLPSQSDGRNRSPARLELHFYNLRGEQLRSQSVRRARGAAGRAQHLHRSEGKAGEGLRSGAGESIRCHRAETDDEIEGTR